MSEQEPFLGPAIVDGNVRFFSPTALEKADTRREGCLRKYFYRYVLRLKEDTTESKDAGKALHAELAQYHKTGVPMLSALAMSGMHLIPAPGPDLWVNVKIHTLEEVAGAHTIIRSHVTAAGVPVIGEMDVLLRRDENKGGDDVLDTRNPPNTAEVIDWKWKKDGSKVEYFAQPRELVQLIQMSCYGVAAPRMLPGVENVRLSHGYFPSTRGRPRKVTRLHVVGEAERSWEYVEGLARTIKDVARETSPERVDHNVHACDRYGGCPYRLPPFNCSGYQQQQSLASIFGETESKEIAMGLLNTLPPVNPPQQMTAPQTQPPLQPPWVPQGSPQYQQAMQTAFAPQQAAPAPQPAAQLDMRAALAAEEAAQRQAQNQVMQGQPQMGFAEACAYIAASGQGFPRLVGAAAMAYAAAGGQNVAPGYEFPGQGQLGQFVTFDNPAFLVQLAGEMKTKAAQQAPAPAPAPQPAPQPVPHFVAPTSILPADAPASNPALAAKPVEVAPGVMLAPPGYVAPAQAGALPVQPPPLYAPQPGCNPQPAPASFNPQPPAQPPAPEKPKRRSRSKAVEAAPAVVQQPAAPSAMVPGFPSPSYPAAPVAPAAGAATTSDDDLEVCVDCLPNGDYESLHPYIDKICSVLCDRYIAPGQLRDIRCAPKESPLGFGAWKGAVNAMVRELPPSPGVYFVDTRWNEIAAEVADALRFVCEQRGTRYTRGVR